MLFFSSLGYLSEAKTSSIDTESVIYVTDSCPPSCSINTEDHALEMRSVQVFENLTWIEAETSKTEPNRSYLLKGRKSLKIKVKTKNYYWKEY